MWSFVGIAGQWPDGAWATTSHPAGRTGFTKLWRWDGKRWVHRQSTRESHFFDFIQPWVGGRQLAVEQAGMMFDARLVVITGDKSAAVPEIERTKDPQSVCMTNFRVEAFDTLPSGEVVAAGLRCDADMNAALAVQRWSPGQKRGVLESLPSAAQDDKTSVAITGLALRSPSDIGVAGRLTTWNRATDNSTDSTYLAHFDGKRWQEVASKIPGMVASLTTGADRACRVAVARPIR